MINKLQSITRIGFRSFLCLFCGLLALICFGTVLAHTELVTANPAPGAQLTTSPTQIELTFSEPNSAKSTILLFGPNFEQIQGIVVLFNANTPTQLVATLPPLEPKTYTVQWTAVSEDGHEVNGSYSFAVIEATEAASAGLSPVKGENSMLESSLRFLLPVYVLVYLGVAFFGRSYLVWRRTGINPYVLGKSDNAHDFIGRMFRLTAVVSTLSVFVYALSPKGYLYLGPIGWLQHPFLILLGVGLLLFSLVWIATAQIQMGNAWRVGIDQAHQTELVQSGLFQWSRNPIFLGMRLNLLGLFLVLPNAVTLAVFILGDVLMQIQVRLEEEYLTQLHGESYQVYCQKVRRWI